MTGSIKDYTPNFNLIIPEFNITGWHDYLEENFRSIDAMFYNVFAINGYKGLWKNSTTYNVNDVIFVDDDGDYNGRLFKILVEHTTPGTGTFTDFYEDNPTLYDRFLDATDAAISAQEARDWAVKLDGPVEDDLYSSKFYANIVNDLSTEITTIYNIRSDIQNVSLIGTEVVNVSNIKNSVQNVANNETNINTTASNETNISTVATNIASVNTNATNMNAINTNASNISVIQSAYSNAQSALNSKNLAQEWATSENLVDNTDYSAKHYAEIASQYENPLRIGQIVESTIPLTDAGLHLLDGALIQGDGIYSEFYDYMVGVLQTYPQIFTNEVAWQLSVTNYGTCGKFVLDDENRTVRLPKITGFIEGTTDLTALSILTQAGVPNITGNISAPGINSISYSTYIVGTGAFSESGTADTIQATTTSGGKKTSSLSFDASRTSSIYGNSSTVQPQSIKVLRYICIATSTKTDIQVDIDEIATDLSGKADKSSFQVVSILPVNPDVDTFYFIPES